MEIRATLVASVFLIATTSAWAQNYQGGVRGSIHDAGGVISSAAVQLADEDTGLSRSTVSNENGEYAFTNVLPGAYRVRVTASGYRTYERRALQIGAQTFLTIDVTLEIGNVSESMTVIGRTSLVDASNASVTTLLDRTTLERLPSAGRNVFFSAAMTPAVIASGNSQFVRQQDQSNSSLISLGGGPRRDNSYVLDGVPIVDILNRASFIPSFQAVEEMRVQISAYDAEIGRTSGGVFNTVGKSGSNQWHGSGLYQDRPGGAQAKSFFAAKTDIANPDTYYHLYGGSLGGPIARNRTFFWASTEGYRSETARSAVLVLPTDAERRGDFSQGGFTIYDPLTTRPDPKNAGQFIRDPFPSNQIPANRLNPVALAVLKYLPLPTSGTSRPATAQLVDAADQLTGKVTHKWSDRLTSTGLFAWYGSTEPDARFYGQPIFQNAADPGDGALVRRVHMLALNNTWALSDRTLLEARYGFNSFLDDNRPAPFDPSQLGFAPSFLSAAPQQKFPGLGVVGYGSGSGFLGDRYQSTATYYSHNASAAVSTLVGRHTVKFGGEYRVNGVRFLNLGGMGGYSFSRDFTFGPNPNQPASSSGDAFASFLLGYPSSGSISTSSPIDMYLNYWAAFVQDDLRLTPKLTLNLGLRYEYEQGLQERNDQIAVGWASDQIFPLQVGGARPDGTPLVLTGGLRYAGVDGAPAHQGNPNPKQFAPRVGVAYARDEHTVIRAGYGLFWAPIQQISADEGGSGTRGYNQTTNFVPTIGNPFIPCSTCSLTNPFPNGFQEPVGNSLGRLTGVGGYISFINPDSRMAHFHRYSVDLQHELPGHASASVGYLGMRGENLSGLTGALDINQLDPKYLALGAALQELVPNPFFDTPLGVGILAGPTVQRAQLLRPYPQFDNVPVLRPSVGRSRYNALAATAERRLSGGWAASANYTWSRLDDNLFGESNFFAGGSTILNNYDVDREYGLSVLDAPHRLNLTGTFELPFGGARRWFHRGGLAGTVLGNWTISAVGSYQSGFPVSIEQSPNNSNLLGSNQRPNVVDGVNPLLTSDPENSYDPTCGCIRWLNPAAWSQAAAFTFGDAPRTDGRARTPIRRNWDLAIDKAQPIGAVTLAVRAELINVFNVADFLGPDIAFGSPTFGQIRSVGGFPRMLQLSVRAAW